MNSDISVVIPAYNQGRFLPQAVESALGQTCPPLEVIVIDDGSTDDTSARLASYRDRVRVVRQPNQGVAATRNHGARQARGELLAFLDADDVWLPAKLERQCRRLRDDPGLGLVHCGVAETDAAGNVLRTRLDGLEGFVAEEMLLFRRPVILGGGSGVVIRRALFEELGGFDTRLSTSADWDLYFRAARRRRVGFVPEVLLRYRLHGSNMHRDFRVMEHDMLHAYAKAFRDGDPRFRHLRRRAYGSLHRMLAGSFFQSGALGRFLYHACASLLYAPAGCGYFLAYFDRRRNRKATEAPL